MIKYIDKEIECGCCHQKRTVQFEQSKPCTQCKKTIKRKEDDPYIQLPNFCDVCVKEYAGRSN